VSAVSAAKVTGGTATRQAPWENEEIALWRDAVRRFARDHVAPSERAWNEAGAIDRESWRRAGELGLFGADLPERWGGVGGHFGHAAVVAEELARVGGNSFRVAATIHVIAAHYVLAFGTDAQKSRWLPGLCSGELRAGVAMSEPGSGSDLQAMRTRALRRDDAYVVDGSKTFITNGSMADLLVLAVKTDTLQKARGISLLLFDTTTPGFLVGKRLEKLGLHASDTCELFFEGCAVPSDCLLGTQEGKGFAQMMDQLPYERAAAAVGNAAAAQHAFELARDYAAERRVFGQALNEFQNTRFELVDVKTQCFVAYTFVDHVIEVAIAGRLDPSLASMAKYWTSEVLGDVVDRCVQIFGGYGYVTDYPITRLYADARIERIYGGTTEIMKEIIGRSL
jgi:acyl-CoA dehydrogenase